MFFENFLAFSTILRCDVAVLLLLSWALSGVLKAVVGPLGYNGEGDTVVKEFLVCLIGGDKPMGKKRGRAARSQKKVFDSTKGFPGEDVAKQLQC